MRRFWAELDFAGKLSLSIALLSCVAVLCVGLFSGKQPMVADEVVHYYMLVTQAGKLPAPNVDVDIPMEGWVYHRQYPHVFLWHYVGAIIWKICGGSFGAVQVYQSLFWLQLLLAVWFMIRHELPGRSDLWMICMAVMASLPMGLLFSVLFFQGIPATAQVVTSFALLRRRQWGWSLLFMALALSIKVTVFVLLPVYFIGFIWVYWRGERIWRTLGRCGLAALIIIISCIPMAVALRKMEFDYYPAATVVKYLQQAGLSFERRSSAPSSVAAPAPESAVQVESSYQRPEICNHPGDLRIPSNWAIYFGGLFWVLMAGGIIGLVLARIVPLSARPGWWWLLLTGLWGVFVTAVHMRSAPDARFFLPAVPFMIAGCTCAVSGLKKNRVLPVVIMAGALLQGGLVLGKTYTLRKIPAGIQEGIDFMKEAQVDPYNYMMYPEGHERFIRGSIIWYMDFQLRDFWRWNNDERLRVLQGYGAGSIIVKKYRVKDVGADTVDLGLYPKSFVDDLDNDPRFRNVFENDAVKIYLLPGATLRGR